MKRQPFAVATTSVNPPEPHAVPRISDPQRQPPRTVPAGAFPGGHTNSTVRGPFFGATGELGTFGVAAGFAAEAAFGLGSSSAGGSSSGVAAGDGSGGESVRGDGGALQYASAPTTHAPPPTTRRPPMTKTTMSNVELFERLGGGRSGYPCGPCMGRQVSTTRTRPPPTRSGWYDSERQRSVARFAASRAAFSASTRSPTMALALARMVQTHGSSGVAMVSSRVSFAHSSNRQAAMRR